VTERVLSEFRDRIIEGGVEQQILDKAHKSVVNTLWQLVNSFVHQKDAKKSFTTFTQQCFCLLKEMPHRRIKTPHCRICFLLTTKNLSKLALNLYRVRFSAVNKKRPIAG
jgi:hypothetical protein